MQLDNDPFFETMFADRGNVVSFLKAFAIMRRRRDRGKIGFERDSLDWISKVWQHAAIAAVGDSGLRHACIHESERYAALRRQVEAGSKERQEPGVVFLCDASDWPHPEVLKGAIKALEHAQIGRLQ